MNLNHKVLQLFDELESRQSQELLRIARQLNSHITADDILQSFDFHELENSGAFRYAEGLMAGLRVAKSALLSLLKEEGIS